MIELEARFGPEGRLQDIQPSKNFDSYRLATNGEASESYNPFLPDVPSTANGSQTFQRD